MAGTIVVGFDGSDQAFDAFALATKLATATDAGVVALNVYPHDRWEIPPPGFADWEQFLREDAEKALARTRKIDPQPPRLETRALAASSPPRGLHDVADEVDAEFVVIGSSHRARLSEILAGSVAMRLLHGSPSPVAVAPRGYAEEGRGGFAEIVVGYDGSAEAEIALGAAGDLAGRLGARLAVAAVVEPPPESNSTINLGALRKAAEAAARAKLDETMRSLPDGTGAEAVVLTGDPAEELARLGREADLLFVGSRAYGPLRRVLLGGVSTALMRSAPCPVIVFPRGVE